MIDALLYSVRDLTRQVFNFSAAFCEVMADGHPPPRMGDYFVAVHPGASRSTDDNYLVEYYSVTLTYTQRVTVPWDRAGDQQLSRLLSPARVSSDPKGPISVNARCERLRAFHHMNWNVVSKANTNLLAMLPPTAGLVYGFAEPLRYRGMDAPLLVGPEWFYATSEEGIPEASQDVGIVNVLRFEDCRRLQGILVPATQPFVAEDGTQYTTEDGSQNLNRDGTSTTETNFW